MSLAALLLVLASGVFHAVWNLMLKRASDRLIFSWSLFAGGGLLLLPPGLVLVPWEPPQAPVLWCVIGSALAFVVYAGLLARSYERGDISLVYPISRAAGPLVTVMGAFVFLDERPTAWGYLGVVLIVLGTVAISWTGDPATAGERPTALRRHRAAVLYALAVGLAIAAFSLVDKVGVTLANPTTYLAMTYLGAGVLMVPLVIWRRGWSTTRREVRRAWQIMLLAGAFSGGGYLLALFAMRLAPAGYVVAVRSLAVLWAVFLGSRVLGEARGPQRLALAGVTVLGLVLIAVWG